MKPLFATSLLLFVLLTSSLILSTMAGTSDYCDSKCKVRCSKAGTAKRCLSLCGICCAKCSCVPSGTYGNKDECPCYRDLRSDKKTPKCP